MLGLTWAALVGYAFLYSPNQTPLRDMYFLEKLVGLGADDGVSVNTIFTVLFNAMGLWPAMYSALIIPTGKSENGVRDPQGQRFRCNVLPVSLIENVQHRPSRRRQP